MSVRESGCVAFPVLEALSADEVMTATVSASARQRPSDPDPLLLRSGAWWLHPAWAAVLSLIPGLAITWFISDGDFQLWWHTRKYFGPADAAIAGLLICAFVAGTMAPSIRRCETAARASQVTVTVAQLRILVQAGRVFFVVSLVAFALWAVMAVSRGYGAQQLHALLTLQPGALLEARKSYLAPVTGVTTLAQLSPLAFVCLWLDRRISGRRHRLALSLLVMATLVRALVNAERLALMELVVPAIVLAAAIRPREERGPRRTWLWAILPLLAPVILIAVFAVFEYTRSWNDFYAQNSDLSYGEFVLRRLAGYYAASTNNSAILLTDPGPFASMPYFTMRFFWDFPFISSLFDTKGIFGYSDPGDSWMAMLWRYGNPELNNEGGLLPAVVDYGMAGSVVWWAVIGLLVGFCYRSLRAGELRGLVLYTVLFVGLIDLSRIFYWGSGRAFVVIAAGIGIAALLHRARARQDQP